MQSKNGTHLVCECAKIASLPFAREREEGVFCGVSRIDIDKEGSALVGRDEGRYVSIDFGALGGLCREGLEEITAVTARELSALLKRQGGAEGGILVAGLGNRRVTHDSLGARVCELLAPREGLFVFAAEVLGKSGIESAGLVRCAAKACGAGAVIAIDSLAARSEERVGRVLQISEGGIKPASGVGAECGLLDRKSLGLPILSVGIPTALADFEREGYLSVGEDLLDICEIGAKIIADAVFAAIDSK